MFQAIAMPGAASGMDNYTVEVEMQADAEEEDCMAEDHIVPEKPEQKPEEEGRSGQDEIAPVAGEEPQAPDDGKGNDKEKKKGGPNRKVKVCCCCEDPAVPGTIYCCVHRATEKTIARQLKWQTKAVQDWAKEAKKNAKSDPDRKWAQLLLRVEIKCPSLGDRTFRALFNFLEHKERYSRKNGVKEKYVARYMSHRMYTKWAVDQGGYSEKEALTEWARMDSYPEWPRKWRGGGKDKALLVHMWDEVEGFSESSHAMEMELAAKRVSVPKTQEDLGARIESLGHGHQRLEDMGGAGATLMKLMESGGMDQSNLNAFASETPCDGEPGKVHKSSDRLDLGEMIFPSGEHQGGDRQTPVKKQRRDDDHDQSPEGSGAGGGAGGLAQRKRKPLEEFEKMDEITELLTKYGEGFKDVAGACEKASDLMVT